MQPLKRIVTIHFISSVQFDELFLQPFNLHPQVMRNVPNILIVSLSLGDFLLILISVPLTSTVYTFSNWPYGEVACKFNHFMQTWSLGVTVFTLTALSHDRYMAIMDPMSKHKGKVGESERVL